MKCALAHYKLRNSCWTLRLNSFRIIHSKCNPQDLQCVSFETISVLLIYCSHYFMKECPLKWRIGRHEEIKNRLLACSSISLLPNSPNSKMQTCAYRYTKHVNYLIKMKKYYQPLLRLASMPLQLLLPVVSFSENQRQVSNLSKLQRLIFEFHGVGLFISICCGIDNDRNSQVLCTAL